jgi:aspartate carbamoyltransferase regulatory subunit
MDDDDERASDDGSDDSESEQQMRTIRAPDGTMVAEDDLRFRPLSVLKRMEAHEQSVRGKQDAATFRETLFRVAYGQPSDEDTMFIENHPKFKSKWDAEVANVMSPVKRRTSYVSVIHSLPLNNATALRPTDPSWNDLPPAPDFSNLPDLGTDARVSTFSWAPKEQRAATSSEVAQVLNVSDPHLLLKKILSRDPSASLETAIKFAPFPNARVFSDTRATCPEDEFEMDVEGGVQVQSNRSSNPKRGRDQSAANPSIPARPPRTFPPPLLPPQRTQPVRQPQRPSNRYYVSRTARRAAAEPVPLMNHGNCCYLNSCVRFLRVMRTQSSQKCVRRILQCIQLFPPIRQAFEILGDMNPDVYDGEYVTALPMPAGTPEAQVACANDLRPAWKFVSALSLTLRQMRDCPATAAYDPRYLVQFLDVGVGNIRISRRTQMDFAEVFVMIWECLEACIAKAHPNLRNVLEDYVSKVKVKYTSQCQFCCTPIVQEDDRGPICIVRVGHPVEDSLSGEFQSNGPGLVRCPNMNCAATEQQNLHSRISFSFDNLRSHLILQIPRRTGGGLNLAITQISPSIRLRGSKYVLVGGACASGDGDVGHYTSMVRPFKVDPTNGQIGNEIGNDWYYVSDSTVQAKTQSEALKKLSKCGTAAIFIEDK